MFEKLKDLFKNVGILTISQFSSKILVFFLIPLYTGILTEEEYGVYDMAVTVVELLFPILTINIVDAVMRFLLDKNCQSKDVITTAGQYVVGGIALSACVLLVVWALNLFPTIDGLEIFVFLYFAFYVLHQFIVQVAKGLEQIKHIGIAGVIGTLSLIAFNLLFLLVFEWGIKGFFIANVLAQVFPTLYLLFTTKIWKHIGHRTDKKIGKEMIAYCFPLIVNTLAWWANSAADKFVVTFMLGAAANGLLAIAYKIPNMLSVLQGIFNQGWQISAIKEFSENHDGTFFSKVVLLINSVMNVGASVLILLTKVIAKFLFAKDFFQAWIFVPLLVLSVVINTNSGIYGAVLSAKKKSKTLMTISLIGILVNVLLNILLVLVMDTQGAVVATVISTVVIFVLRKIIVGKAFNTPWDIAVYFSFIVLAVQSCLVVYSTAVWALVVELALLALLIATYVLAWIKNIKSEKKNEESN